MAYRVPLTNFSKGELGPLLYGRFDVSAYASALKQARNVIVQKYGGVTKRPGTRLVAEVADASQPVRLVPFQFSIDQAYALEVGQGYMRPAAGGGMVLEEELAITGITNALQAQVTSRLHGYKPGDSWFVSGVAGMTEINERILRVVSILSEDQFIVDHDTRGYGAFTGSTGGITRTAPPPDEPVAPVVPDPVPDPEPPYVGGGGGGGRGGRLYNPNEVIP